mmetsp:Transcript_26395/g.51288  ORF Transcript_26395/g.51288 Transcript_26395/m.51288 type:complete len:276 (+) Transcript_26395:105-932(+)
MHERNDAKSVEQQLAYRPTQLSLSHKCSHCDDETLGEKLQARSVIKMRLRAEPVGWKSPNSHLSHSVKCSLFTYLHPPLTYAERAPYALPAVKGACARLSHDFLWLMPMTLARWLYCSTLLCISSAAAESLRQCVRPAKTSCVAPLCSCGAKSDSRELIVRERLKTNASLCGFHMACHAPIPKTTACGLLCVELSKALNGVSAAGSSPRSTQTIVTRAFRAGRGVSAMHPCMSSLSCARLKALYVLRHDCSIPGPLGGRPRGHAVQPSVRELISR